MSFVSIYEFEQLNVVILFTRDVYDDDALNTKRHTYS
jgi:hypothetical protein